MRHLVALALALVTLVAQPRAVRAQDVDTGLLVPEERRSRWAFGIHGVGGNPIGDFARNVDDVFGGQLDVRYALDPWGLLSLRGDLAMGGHGMRQAGGGGLFGWQARATTRNVAGQALVGLELAIPAGPVRPYANAGIGTGWFATQTTFDDRWARRGRNDFTRTHLDDWVAVRTAGGGVRVPIGRGMMLDVAARRAWSGVATYATPADVRTGTTGGIVVSPRRSRTDQWLFSAGLSFGR